MQELMSKSAMSATSPVARTGGGDISEREFSRERHNLQTPPTRIQRTHPKRQLFSAPVNKFTARPPGSSSNLVRIRSCLNEYNKPGVTPRKRAVAKAASMEDLTPGKIKKAEQCKAMAPLHVVPRVWSGLKSEESARAAARVSRFMLLAAWRRRREEVRCLKKTLINQVSCSERLRLQVSSLKTLVESDSSKVRLAIRELERLRQRLHDKDEEKAVLQREKTALEKDVIAAEDKASECSIGWRNSMNELASVKSTLSLTEQALSLERAAAIDARSQMELAYARLADLEGKLSEKTAQLAAADALVAQLTAEGDEKKKMLDKVKKKLRTEIELRDSAYRQKCVSAAALSASRAEVATLQRVTADLRADLASTNIQLKRVRDQLAWWPAPLTKMMGTARAWYQRSMPLSDAIIWSMTPSRYGC